MKVALLLSGLARKVREGYEQYWSQLLNRYDVDIYLHAWKDEEYQLAEALYSPNVKLIETPFSFRKCYVGVESPNDDMSRPTMPYDVAGNFRQLPMFYSWQRVWRLIPDIIEYDYVIRSRYDMAGPFPALEDLSPDNIHISNVHWPNSSITDDNLLITSHHLAKALFNDCFDDLLTHIQSTGEITFAEKSLMLMLQRKHLWSYVRKTNLLDFQLLRDNKLWY